MSPRENKLGFRQQAWPLAGALLLASLASPASASPEASAKLVHCSTGSCLRISGHRESPTSIVRINGNVVPAEGRRKWAVELPIHTVRDWSAPHARTIEVALDDPATQRGATASVDLPIGLLGGVNELTSLVVNVG
jgi:hypothetical protein